MIERRTAQRHRTLKTGLIVFNGGRSTLTCVVRNLSDTGALLKVEISAGIPGGFALRISGGRLARSFARAERERRC